ncbi:MAG: FHA domain-containing protein [Chloroflexota bacterium]
MTRYALSWAIGPRIEAFELEPAHEYVIGRDPSSEVVLDHPTVSRRQARVRGDGSRMTIENLSTTNPTKLGGAAIVDRVELDDGASIKAGEVPVSFWDLAAGDRLSGPRCSHCQRENSSSDQECWYCGTSLVNAPTTIRSKLRVACLLVGPDGTHPVLDDGVLEFSPDGIVLPGRSPGGVNAPSIAVQGGTATLHGHGTASIEGEKTEPGEASRPLVSGDHIVIGARTYAVIVR